MKKISKYLIVLMLITSCVFALSYFDGTMGRDENGYYPPGLYQNNKCVKYWDTLKKEYPNAFGDNYIGSDYDASFYTTLSGFLVIDDSVNTIGAAAFKNCTKLTGVRIPSSVTIIGEHAFEGCTNLIDVTLPNTIEYIQNWTFKDCTKLKNINIPESVTVIRDLVFTNCSSLSTINLPSNLIEIGYYAFQDCTSLKKIILPESVTYLGEDSFKGSAITEINIPSNVSTIKSSAFEDCSALTSVTIDSPTVANGITSQSSYGYLLSSAITVYIKDTLSVYFSDYLENHFSRDNTGKPQKDGYNKYTRTTSLPVI